MSVAFKDQFIKPLSKMISIIFINSTGYNDTIFGILHSVQYTCHIIFTYIYILQNLTTWKFQKIFVLFSIFLLDRTALDRSDIGALME